ncbi:MAG: DMT family transporter [Actinomycetota bacterium]|nr:DMT family transporter [Actinomycetota bacterium]
MGPRGAGVTLVATSAAAFGALPVLAKVAYASGAEPTALLVVRFTVASVAMLAIMAARRYAFPRGRLLAALALLGGVGYVGQSLAFFTAASLISAGLTTLLLYLYPAMVTVAAVLLLSERLTRGKVVALTLAVAGTALTVGEAGNARPVGVLLGVAAAVIYAGYILAGSRVTPRVGAIPASTIIILAAAASYTVIATVQRPAFPQSAAGWAAAGAIALVSTVVALVTFFAGMERIGVTDASTLSTLEPVVTVGLAAVVLGERILPLQLLGGALILCAVVLLARAGQRKLPAPDAPA